MSEVISRGGCGSKNVSRKKVTLIKDCKSWVLLVVDDNLTYDQVNISATNEIQNLRSKALL